MDFFDWLYNTLMSSQFITVPYIAIFILLSYVIKKHFGELLSEVTKTKWKTSYTVLVIGILLAIPFLIFTDEGWQKIGLSYTLGTSLYEIAFRWIEKKESS